MATKSKKGLYIGIVIVTIAIVASIIVYYYTIVKPKKDLDRQISDSENAGSGTSAPSTSGGSTSTGNPTGPAPLSNNTILKWKSPLMKGDRVQWLQNYYNKYVKLRQSLNKTPSWPTLDDDGVFGENTHKAVFRVMGKHETSWQAFKDKVDQQVKGLGVTPIGEWWKLV